MFFFKNMSHNLIYLMARKGIRDIIKKFLDTLCFCFSINHFHLFINRKNFYDIDLKYLNSNLTMFDPVISALSLF